MADGNLTPLLASVMLSYNKYMDYSIPESDKNGDIKPFTIPAVKRSEQRQNSKNFTSELALQSFCRFDRSYSKIHGEK